MKKKKLIASAISPGKPNIIITNILKSLIGIKILNPCIIKSKPYINKIENTIFFTNLVIIFSPIIYMYKVI